MTEFGIGTYTRNVVRALGRLDRETEYFLIGSPQQVQEIGPLPPNFQTVPLLEPDRSIRAIANSAPSSSGSIAIWSIFPIFFPMPRRCPVPMS